MVSECDHPYTLLLKDCKRLCVFSKKLKKERKNGVLTFVKPTHVFEEIEKKKKEKWSPCICKAYACF